MTNFLAVMYKTKKLRSTHTTSPILYGSTSRKLPNEHKTVQQRFYRNC